jgi:8-oxo-dGTP diphosphatase
MGNSRNKIQVACAIIEKDGRVLTAQRSETMSLPLKWEFPGGKIEPQESAAACLSREILEELGISIRILVALPSSNWAYPDFDITLHPFVCDLCGGSIQLLEHRAICWLTPEKLPTLDWAEADGPVLRAYLQYLRTDDEPPAALSLSK